MATMTEDTSLDFLLSESEPDATETKSVGDGEVVRKAEEVRKADEESDAESTQRALDDIVGVLVPKIEGEENVETSKRQKVETEEEGAPETKVTPTKQPVIHDPRLIQLADTWGIAPNEAARYATTEALLGAVAIRELRWRNAAEARSHEATKPRSDEETDDLAFPEIKLDEDVDPAIKQAVNSLASYAKKIKDWADGKLSAQNQELQNLRTGHEQAAETNRLVVEAKNAQMFDDKVKLWGDEFKELLGTPTQTWQQVGTPQHAELVRLHMKTRQLAEGFAMLEGRSPTSDELGGFIDEARYALWPDRIKVAVRNEISNGLKKQRGGVGLRPGRARSAEAPEQGDDAAKAAIGDFMASHGLDPWARRSA